MAKHVFVIFLKKNKISNLIALEKDGEEGHSSMFFFDNTIPPGLYFF